MTSKAPGATTPPLEPEARGRSTTGYDPWRDHVRHTESLLGRLKKTWTENASISTQGDRFAAPARRQTAQRGPDANVVRLVREAFYAKFTNLAPGEDEEIVNERSYYSEKIAEAISEVLAERRLKLPDETVDRIRDDLLEGILGFGPMQKLLEDPDVTEIMVNGPNRVYVEKSGKLFLSDITFTDSEQLLKVIDKIVVPLGRRIDESCPLTDARLPDGSRVNIVIPPLALSGPTITIRKFRKIPLKLSDMVSAGSLSREMAIFLEGCVRSKLNVIISGETGSGKTTTLNALSGFLPMDCRIVTIEDSAELQLQQDHVVSLEARQSNVEGRGEITIRDLLRNALHMIPDRIIVGECRGGEALDMLNAMSSGNEGSMTTGHANSARDLVGRLETMVMMAGMGLPSEAIREQIASAVHLIVQQERSKDGVRRVVSIAEISGYQNGQVVVSDIFRWDPQAPDPSTGEPMGAHVATGRLPTCLKRLLRDDFFVPDGTFGADVDIEQIREELRRRDEEENRAEQDATRARIVMQQALLSPDEENVAEAESQGTVFHWRHAMLMGGQGTGAGVPAPATHQDRLRELSRQLSERRQGLEAQSAKDEADERLAEELHALVVEKLPSAGAFEELEKQYASIEEERRILTARIERALDEILAEFAIALSAPLRKRVIGEVSNDVIGLGPLQELIEDRDVNEIMVNGASKVFVERKGRLELSRVTFKDDSHLRHIISQILRPINRRVDETTPMVDARLRDGSRVNIVIPPISLAGPVLTIRKFAADPLDEQDLIEFGTMTSRLAAFLNAGVRSRVNMVISGGTGSGKTTTLNVVSSYISDDVRIITVEDAAELQLQQPHVVPLESRPANIEGRGAVSIRQLVMNALHMRPDRIIVGECRGGEALDMLMAMNTGHDGSLTTLHSNSPYDTILRLQTLVMLAGMNLPLRAINEQIAGAIQLIIHQDRLGDGSRRITHVTELEGFEEGKPVLQDLFKWKSAGVGPDERHLGELVATGHVPTFINRFVEDNIALPEATFGPDVDIDRLYAKIQADQIKRAEQERVRLQALAKAEDEKLSTGASSPSVRDRPDLRVTNLPSIGAPPQPAVRSNLQSKVFTWKDMMRPDERGDSRRNAPVRAEQRWDLVRQMRSLNKVRTARREQADDFEQARALLSGAVAEELETVAIPDDFTGVESERLFMSTLIQQVLNDIRSREGMLLDRSREGDLLHRVLSDFCGFGPIQQLMDDAEVSEIMVNGPKNVFIERRGRIERTDLAFNDDAHIHQILQRMLTPVNRRCDLGSPMVDARLGDGSRINAVIPPLAVSGSTLTIRKFARDPYTIDALVEMGAMSADMAAFLRAAVHVRQNIVVSGGTGSGKTTTLNAISAFIPEQDRIISIEDTAELQLQQDHVVSLESRPPNLEGRGQVTIRELVRNALHMRPERIIVGECRGGEALDMLQAMSTGQSGSLTTGHANTPREMVSRLEVMVLMAGTGIAMRSIREQICNTIDIVVQQQRFKDGTRKVTHVSEVLGLDDNGEVRIENLFEFVPIGIDTDGMIVGEYRPTGRIPECLKLFRSANVVLRDDIFGSGTSVEREYARIDRQREIEEQREKGLERMRFRSEGERPSRGGRGPEEVSGVGAEIARRQVARAGVAEILDARRSDDAGPEAGAPGVEPHFAQEMRRRIAEKPAEERDVSRITSEKKLDYLTPAAGPEGTDTPAHSDLGDRLRTRKRVDNSLLRRLRDEKIRKGEP